MGGLEPVLSRFADLARVGDLSRGGLREVFDAEATVLLGGRWWDFEQVSAARYFRLRDQVRALPDHAWLAVLDAHL